MTDQAPDATGQHGMEPLLAARAAGGEQRDVERVVEPCRQRLGALERTDDQQAALAAEAHRGHRLRIVQLRGREQGGHLRGGGRPRGPSRQSRAG